jgi:hypothetical protein
MAPGPAPGGGGGMVPPAPNPADVLGMLGGGGEGAPSQISRLSVPLGDGSFAGSQMGG